MFIFLNMQKCPYLSFNDFGTFGKPGQAQILGFALTLYCLTNGMRSGLGSTPTSIFYFTTVVCNTLGVLNALGRDRESLIDLDHL